MILCGFTLHAAKKAANDDIRDLFSAETSIVASEDHAGGINEILAKLSMDQHMLT